MGGEGGASTTQSRGLREGGIFPGTSGAVTRRGTDVGR